MTTPQPAGTPPPTSTTRGVHLPSTGVRFDKKPSKKGTKKPASKPAPKRGGGKR